MLNRSNLILAAALLVQVILVALSVGARSGSQDRSAQPLLPDFEADNVLELVIEDDLENTVTIARRAEVWVLPEADEFPVNSDQAESLLEGVAGLQTGRLVASNPANFARLEVADRDFRRKLSLVSADATSALYLGGGAGADTVYVRLDGANQTYLGAGLSAWDASTQVSAWIDASYVDVPQVDVMRMKVTNANGSFEFARTFESAFEQSDDAWRYLGLPDGATLEDTKLPGILRNAAALRMVEPLGLSALAEYGMDQPQATVEVEYRQLVETETTEETDSTEDMTESGSEAAADDSNSEDNIDNTEELSYTSERYTLAFGAQLADGNIVLKSSTSDYYVTVRDYALDAFADLKHADLLRVAEAAPETASEG